MMHLDDTFEHGIPPKWTVTHVGRGTVTADSGGLRLEDSATPDGVYSNAQITDYAYDAFDFQWSPPLRMSVTAYASAHGDALRGTAGFGFWNHPFSPDMRRMPRLPRALWFFFASPPSNLALALGVPGHGWKAAALDMTRPRALALAPLAPAAVLLMQAPMLYERVWSPLQRRLGISEHLLDNALLAERHTYTIDWRRDGATFAVDGEPVYETPDAPRGACGFIAWIDNQYAVVTPRGRFGWGLLPLDQPQSLMIEQITIEKG